MLRSSSPLGFAHYGAPTGAEGSAPARRQLRLPTGSYGPIGSRAGSAASSPQPGAALRPLAAPALEPDQAGRQLALMPSPGLRNESGEYNCFLNAVVQCLWRCRAIRAGLLALQPTAVQVGPPAMPHTPSRLPLLLLLLCEAFHPQTASMMWASRSRCA